MFKTSAEYQNQSPPSTSNVQSVFSLRRKNVEIAVAVIYHYCSLKICKVEKDGIAEGF
jgi:hypothetical protein